jgi:hypothetical protein
MRRKPSEIYRNYISKFKQILGLDQSKNDFRFETNLLKSGSNELVVRTRWLMGMFFDLSHAIEVPREDIERRVVQTTIGEDGSIFNWSQDASGT